MTRNAMTLASRIENFVAREGLDASTFTLAEALGCDMPLNSLSREDLVGLESAFRNRPIYSDPRRREVLAVVSSLSLSLSLRDCSEADILVHLDLRTA